MARDLMPPPSPAGRPAPDGTPNLIELPPEPPRSPSQPEQQPALGPSEFRNRFGFLLGALAGVFIAAALVTVLVVSTDGNASDDGLYPDWSAWRPTDTSVEGGAAQIAAKVESEYWQSNGKQLVMVTGSPLDANVALRASTGRISLFDNPGVLYKLDGLGPNGSILDGERSANRLKLLQREALELALYTFRYLPDVEQVMTLLPPPPPTDEQKAAEAEATSAAQAAQAAAAKAAKTGKKEDVAAAEAAAATAAKKATITTADPLRRAIFHRPGDLKPQLLVPLGQTIPAKAATPDNLSAAELHTINLLTGSNLFNWSLPDPSRPLLVLDYPTSP